MRNANCVTPTGYNLTLIYSTNEYSFYCKKRIVSTQSDQKIIKSHHFLIIWRLKPTINMRYL